MKKKAKKRKKTKKTNELYFWIPLGVLLAIYIPQLITNKNNVLGWIICLAVLAALYFSRKILLKMKPVAVIAIWVAIALLLVIPFAATISPDLPSLPSQIFLQILKSGTAKMPQEGPDKLQYAKEFRIAIEGMMKKYKLPENIMVEEVNADGVPAEWVYKKGTSSDKVVYYIHGGAFIIGSKETTRSQAVGLAQAVGDVKVLSISYRLAPENPFPAALEDALKAYHWLLAQGIPSSNIVFAGDSAGGNLIFTVALALKEKKEPLPAALIAMSPVTDLTFSGETHKTKVKDDPILGKANTKYLNEMLLGKDITTDADKELLKNPLLSPLYGDLRGLPPMLIHVGSNEIMLDQSTRFAEKAKAAGVDVTLKVWNGMWHVFQAVGSFLPESKRSMREIGEFARKYLGLTAVSN